MLRTPPISQFPLRSPLEGQVATSFSADADLKAERSGFPEIYQAPRLA
jgi:hypothetical protein